jgi:hypothetical protein
MTVEVIIDIVNSKTFISPRGAAFNYTEKIIQQDIRNISGEKYYL